MSEQQTETRNVFEKVELPPFTIYSCATPFGYDFVQVEYEGDLASLLKGEPKVTSSPYNHGTHLSSSLVFTLPQEVTNVLARFNPENVNLVSSATNWGEISLQAWYTERCFERALTSKMVYRKRFSTQEKYLEKIEEVKTELARGARLAQTSILPEAVTWYQARFNHWKDAYLKESVKRLTSGELNFTGSEIKLELSKIKRLQAALNRRQATLRQLKGQEVVEYLNTETSISSVAKDQTRAAIDRDEAFHNELFFRY